MRVLMTGGGTGGHVNPAIAIADTIRENVPDAQIAFVGTNRGIENKLVPQAGYRLFHVNVMGLRRSLSPKNIKAAYLALTSPRKARRVIHEWNPDIVIGTGGYVSWPVVKAAAGMGIPTALHESNAVPGMAVKMLSGVVDRISGGRRGTTLSGKASSCRMSPSGRFCTGIPGHCPQGTGNSRRCGLYFILRRQSWRRAGKCGCAESYGALHRRKRQYHTLPCYRVYRKRHCSRLVPG